MHFPKLNLASVGSLVRKSLGKEEGMLGLVLKVEEKKGEASLSAYVVLTEDGKVSDWMTCFVDVLSEVD